MKPFFSIIVACCDVAPYIEDCLRSILNQSFQDWECILGIETSKDRTEEIIREKTADDPRFKIFTSERTGSCSASRNTGIDMAQGEYIIFLDGDDAIIEESLQRLFDKITVRPGGDLYPCAVQVRNEITDSVEELRDNYPDSFNGELTGPEATVFVSKFKTLSQPMMQMTICRREFLLEHGLKCIHGLRGQDREFSPRALFWAKRVIPLHEAFYLYRIRPGSIMRSVTKPQSLVDQAIIHKSLFAFHTSVKNSPNFDSRLTVCWGHSWTSWILYLWFAPVRIKSIPRAERLAALELLFADGFEDFKSILRGAPLHRKIACWWFCTFVRHSSLRSAAELFFQIYFAIVLQKNNLTRKKGKKSDKSKI